MASVSGYRRRDLRSELLAAGRDYITQNGHASLSVRELAQRVGVSPGAPYRHFPDRRAMLLALALEGFGELVGRARAIAETDQDPRRKLDAIARDFIEFAREQPNLLELMYDSELTRPEIDPTIREEHVRGYGVLRGCLAEVMIGCSDEFINLRVVVMWSALYGFASLLRRTLIQHFLPVDFGPAEVSSLVASLVVKNAP